MKRIADILICLALGCGVGSAAFALIQLIPVQEEVCEIPPMFDIGQIVSTPYGEGVIVLLDRIECGKAWYGVRFDSVCRIISTDEMTGVDVPK